MPKIQFDPGEIKNYGDGSKPLLISANRNFMYGFAPDDIVHTYHHTAHNSDMLGIPSGYGVLWVKASMALTLNVSVGH